jgi:hypothetical protein
MRSTPIALLISGLLAACNHSASIPGDVAGGAASADLILDAKKQAARLMVEIGGYDSFVLGFTSETPASKAALTKSSAVDLFRTTFDIDDAVPHFEVDSAKFRPVIFVTMSACQGLVRRVGTLNQKTGLYEAVISGDFDGLSCPDLIGAYNQEFKMYVTSLENLMNKDAVTDARYTLIIGNDE